MSNYGIDYGMGTTNVDPDTHIRYGVISMNEVVQAWADSCEYDYPCEECDAYDKENEECMGDCQIDALQYINDEKYVAYADSMGDIIIEKSPYYTYAMFCSPCAPGACHLNNPIEHTEDEHKHASCRFPISNPSELKNNKCYCFGHDMFWDSELGHAQYKVYSVETDQLVEPE
jgi:hypothetical protein